MWRRAVAVGSLAAIISIAGGFITTRQAYATGVTATVCGPTVSSPVLTINRPASDSTYPSGQVTLTGTVSYTNQLEVQVDGAYSSTLSVVSGQMPNPYSFDLQLSKGQHRVDVIAAGMCGASGTTETVFLTVDLKSDTATVVPPPTTSITTNGGVVIGPEDIKDISKVPSSDMPSTSSSNDTTPSSESSANAQAAAIRSYVFFVGLLALGTGTIAASSLPLLGAIQSFRWWLIGAGAIIMLLSLLLDL